MKRLIIVSVSLLILLGLGWSLYTMECLLTKHEKDNMETESVDRALYGHTLDCYKEMVSKTVTTLEDRITTIERKSGINTLGIIVGKGNPTAFRCRLDRQAYTGENCDQIRMDVNNLLQEVILLEHVIDAQPNAQKKDKITAFRNFRYKNTGEEGKILQSTMKEYLNILNRQSLEIEKLKGLTESDVPEEKIAWQRKLISGR